MNNEKELNDFYYKIEKSYTALLRELMQKDCEHVEFIRGMLAVYEEILSDKKHWQRKVVNYF